MRFLRFALLDLYFKYSKNKRKALLIINTGIFFNFCFFVSNNFFFIEKKFRYSKSINGNQIETRYSSNMISYVENEINILAKSLFKEENFKAKKDFLMNSRILKE